MSVGAVNKQTGERIPTAGIPAVDSVLSGESTNPVQNKVVKEALDTKQDAINYSITPQKTGYKWIDGKDVYIVVLPFDATNGGASIDVTALNIDIAFCVGCFCQEEIYQTHNLAITQLYNTSGDKFTFQLNGARTAINVSVGDEKKGHGAIILCYTESVGN